MVKLKLTKDMDDFLDNSKTDVQDSITYMDFFVHHDYVDEVKPFHDNFEEFSNSIKDMKTHFLSHDFMIKLEYNGLIGKEKTRKLRIYDTARKIYYKSKQAFFTAFKKFWDEFYHKRNEMVDFDTPINKFRKLLRKLYDHASKKLREFKVSKEKLLNIINVILKSAANAFGVGDLASEFKDTLEFVTETERTPSLIITCKRLGRQKIKNLITTS